MRSGLCLTRLEYAVDASAANQRSGRVRVVVAPSPPRLRGAQFARAGGQVGAGITPAHTGEHNSGRFFAVCRAGSPPRLRGAQPVTPSPPATRPDHPAPAGSAPESRSRAAAHRITPAPAGSTSWARTAPLTRDRPRAPAGALRLRPVDHDEDGITPAPAGSTRTWSRTPGPPRDHPRASTATTAGTARCRPDHPRASGEHANPVGGRDFSVGSSPRLREHAAWIFDHTTEQGSPRACGDHIRHSPIGPLRCGSSPRPQGACYGVKRRRRYRRITPAFWEHEKLTLVDPAEGNQPRVYESTGRSSRSWRRWRDDPCVQGEHHDGNCSQAGPVGSPSHLRGARNHHRLHEVGDRITPAPCGGAACRAVRPQGDRGSPPRLRGPKPLEVGHPGPHRITPRLR